MPVFILSEKLKFPPPHFAEKEGLLAVGGDLTADRLLLAYRQGIFPWYSGDEPILWWSPDPRLILYPKDLNISKSLNKILRKKMFDITMDRAFERVIRACSNVRIEKGEGTWITDEMLDAYCRLHKMGYAHSVEAWQGETLCGGLYGVSLGKSFFGESMFVKVSNASKAAFVFLVESLDRWGFDLVDCQVKTDHLLRFGAKEVPRRIFLRQLEKSLKKPTKRGKWHF